MNLKIKANYDKGIISFEFDDIKGDIPIVDFAEITAKHIATGCLMTTLIKNYLRRFHENS